jgi:hypothetical protein
VVATTDVAEVGGFPRKEGMERKDVMSKNVSIYKAQASALEQHAAKDVKVGPLEDIILNIILASIVWFCCWFWLKCRLCTMF